MATVRTFFFFSHHPCPHLAWLSVTFILWATFGLSMIRFLGVGSIVGRFGQIYSDLTSFVVLVVFLQAESFQMVPPQLNGRTGCASKGHFFSSSSWIPLEVILHIPDSLYSLSLHFCHQMDLLFVARGRARVVAAFIWESFNPLIESWLCQLPPPQHILVSTSGSRVLSCDSGQGLQWRGRLFRQSGRITASFGVLNWTKPQTPAHSSRSSPAPPTIPLKSLLVLRHLSYHTTA